MPRRRFYLYLAASILTLLFLYTSLGIFFLRERGITPYNTGRIKMALAILVLFTETTVSNKWMKAFGLVMFPIFIVGYLFMVMHWPFGREMCLGALSAIILMVFMNAIRSSAFRFERLITLIFPVCHFAYEFSRMVHWSPMFLWWLDYLATGVTGIGLWLILLKKGNARI